MLDDPSKLKGTLLDDGLTKQIQLHIFCPQMTRIKQIKTRNSEMLSALICVFCGQTSIGGRLVSPSGPIAVTPFYIQKETDN